MIRYQFVSSAVSNFVKTLIKNRNEHDAGFTEDFVIRLINLNHHNVSDSFGLMDKRRYVQ